MTIDTPVLLEQLRTAVHHDVARRRRRRRVVLAAAAFATVVVGGVGIAGTFDDWWTGAEPAVQPRRLGELADENRPAGIELDLSKKATVARTDDAVLVAVATKSGGYCMSLFLADGHGMGSSCDNTPVEGDGTGSAYLTRADESHWIAYGRMTDTGAAALDLSGAGLPAQVPLERGGFFLLDIPHSQWDALDGRSGDIAILGAGGRMIRSTCIYVGHAPGTKLPGGGILGDKPGECAKFAPIVPDPVLAQARRLVTLTLTHAYGRYAAGDSIAIWVAPNRSGGTCTLVGAAAQPQGPSGPMQCGGGQPRSGLTLAVGSSLEGGVYVNLLYGFAGERITRVELVGRDGTVPVAFGGGAFLAELPSSPKVGKGPGPIPGGPYRVVGYDAAGQEVDSRPLPTQR